MKRLDALDWLRGGLAFSIMIYHLLCWEYTSPDSSSILGRLGIYGVSMFFVLSGLSMAYVYCDRLHDVRSGANFFLRRLFRILPLLWVAIIGALLLIRIESESYPSFARLALNATTLFGFIRPDAYINVGAWSIGNEMVYYSLTPLIIFLYNRKIIFGNIFFALTAGVAVLFSTHMLSGNQSLGAQWSIYINPFNNLFFFCSGLAVYYNLRSINWGIRTQITLLCISVSLLLFIPVTGDQINIVTGIDRVFFSCASILLVVAFYKNSILLPDKLSNSLEKIGILTYGIYLLHPIIYKSVFLIMKRGEHRNSFLIMIITIVITLLASSFSYRYIEAPFMRFGKKLMRQWTS